MADEIKIEKPAQDSAGAPHRLADQLVKILNSGLDEENENAHQFALRRIEMSRGEWATVVWALRSQPKGTADGAD